MVKKRPAVNARHFFRPSLIKRRTLGETLRRRFGLAVAPQLPPRLILVRAVVLVLGDSEALDLQCNLAVKVQIDVEVLQLVLEPQRDLLGRTMPRLVFDAVESHQRRTDKRLKRSVESPPRHAPPRHGRSSVPSLLLTQQHPELIVCHDVPRSALGHPWPRSSS